MLLVHGKLCGGVSSSEFSFSASVRILCSLLNAPGKLRSGVSSSEFSFFGKFEQFLLIAHGKF